MIIVETYLLKGLVIPSFVPKGLSYPLFQCESTGVYFLQKINSRSEIEGMLKINNVKDENISKIINSEKIIIKELFDDKNMSYKIYAEPNDDIELFSQPTLSHISFDSLVKCLNRCTGYYGFIFNDKNAECAKRQELIDSVVKKIIDPTHPQNTTKEFNSFVNQEVQPSSQKVAKTEANLAAVKQVRLDALEGIESVKSFIEAMEVTNKVESLPRKKRWSNAVLAVATAPDAEYELIQNSAVFPNAYPSLGLALVDNHPETKFANRVAEIVELRDSLDSYNPISSEINEIIKTVDNTIHESIKRIRSSMDSNWGTNINVEKGAFTNFAFLNSNEKH